MSIFNIAILVGSLRKESNNLKLAKALMKLGEERFNASILRIDDLPLFNEDLEKDFPAPAQRMKGEIEKADAVLFVTPEYNRSMPAPLKNAIDWASRPYGKNSFAGKPAGIIGTSPGALGTACAQHNLRPTMAYLDVAMMGQPEAYIQFKDGLIDFDGNIGNESTRKFLQGWVDKYCAWVERQRNAQSVKKAA